MLRAPTPTEVLNYPLAERINYLKNFIENGPIKDLTTFYPQLVNSIFGINDPNIYGWRLRLVTDQNFQEFRLLYDFLHPLGPFFGLIYRLLNDTIKYELKVSDLPRQLLENGNSSFYSNMFHTDNFQKNKNSVLSLNAFDYFFFQFCDHGTKNFHKSSLAALNINNENLITVYFNLTADYLCNFLPSQPNGTVYPSISMNYSHLPIKDEQQIQYAHMNNSRSPKYLKISNLSKNLSQNHQIKEDYRYSEKAKSVNWRSESILMIFVDSWLNYDFERELPGNEFIRLTRILIKQLHFFGNSADADMSSLSVLRRQSATTLNSAIYSFLLVVTSRWPLDTSFLNVLEVWLSYIQPWRYTNFRDVQVLNSDQPIEIPNKFKSFVKENLNCYSQIFAKIISRFLKMDINSNKNVFMLFRMVKIFGQLQDILRILDRNSNVSNNSKLLYDNSHNSLSFMSNNASGSSDIHSSKFIDNSTVIDDMNSTSMFSNESLLLINNLMRKMCVAKDNVEKIISNLESTLKENFSSWEKILNIFGWMSSSNTSIALTLEEKKKTKIYLDFCMETVASIYDIPIDIFMRNNYQDETLIRNDEGMDKSSINNLMSPTAVKRESLNIKFMGDSLYMPVKSQEIPFIARFAHKISRKFNEVFEHEMQQNFVRNDLVGKIARLILEPPEEIKVVNKSAGYSQIESFYVGPRLNLRNNYFLISVLLICFISLLYHLFKFFY